MSPDPRADHLLVCTFCKRDEHQVQQLISGPGVYICDACVGLCNRILEGKGPGSSLRAGAP
jgi:ATP-dependent Clp protease ATP-binding subunit ClpX